MIGIKPKEHLNLKMVDDIPSELHGSHLFSFSLSMLDVDWLFPMKLLPSWMESSSKLAGLILNLLLFSNKLSPIAFIELPWVVM